MMICLKICLLSSRNAVFRYRSLIEPSVSNCPERLHFYRNFNRFRDKLSGYLSLLAMYSSMSHGIEMNQSKDRPAQLMRVQSF